MIRGTLIVKVLHRKRRRPQRAKANALLAQRLSIVRSFFEITRPLPELILVGVFLFLLLKNVGLQTESAYV